MSDAEELSPLGCPHKLKSIASYEIACQQCEITRTFTSEQLSHLCDNLIYERSRDSCHGRGLARDMPEFNLRRGDRVEATAAIPDVGAIDEMVGPVTISFWRRVHETSARRRFPLFGHALNLGPENIGIDWLHTFSLGVASTWVSMAVWDLINANVFSLAVARADHISMSFSRIAGLLGDWIAKEKKEGRHHTAPQKFQSSMFGTNANRKCGLHGAETNSFVRFLGSVLDVYSDRIANGIEHVDACASLIIIMDIIHDHSRKVPVAQRTRFCKAVQVLLVSFRRIGAPERPKEHLMIDMAGRLGTHGSPALVACWDDESRNFPLKRLCEDAHRSVWHARVLSGWAARSDHLSTAKRVRRN